MPYHGNRANLPRHKEDTKRLHGAIFIKEELKKDDEIRNWKDEIKNCSFRISEVFGFRKEQWRDVRYLLKFERYSETFEKAPDLKIHNSKLSQTLRLCKTVNAERAPNKKPRGGPATTKTKQIISRYYHQKAVDNATLPSHHHICRSHDGYLTPYQRPPITYFHSQDASGTQAFHSQSRPPKQFSSLCSHVT